MAIAQTFLEQLKSAASSGTNFGAFAAPAARELAVHAVNKVDSVMALPEVTTKILAAVDDPNTTTQQLCSLVSQDPSLMTRILTVVNSSLFGLRGKMDSIERAVVHVGLRGVKQLAVAAGLGQVFRGRGVEDCTPKRIWLHSIAVAVAARQLAQEVSLPGAEEIFIAGLVHDLGLLVAIQVFPRQLQLVCQQAKSSNIEFCELERQCMGTDHQLLGEALASRWKFPQICRVAASSHHAPMSAMFADRQPVAVMHVADTMCCQSQSDYGFNLTARNQPVDFSIAAGAGIDQAAIDRVSQKLPQLISDASSLVA
jgi:HD-like signal output (HDOD) protein